MKFYQLIHKYTFKQLKEAMLTLYPDQRKSLEGYVLAYQELLELKPIINQDLNFTIDIKLVEDEDDSYVDVYGKGFDNVNYGLDFLDWQDILELEIESSAFERYSEIEILTHILWEITFYGYSNQEVNERNKQIMGYVKEIEKDLDISIDEIE